MGKPGGFFKKLKAKQKKEASHKRRGTTGMDKADRVEKFNNMVDYYKASRQAAELADLSSSSSDAADTSSSSEDEHRVGTKRRRVTGDPKLEQLRALLGVAKKDKDVSDDDDDADAPPDYIFEDEEDADGIEEEEGEEVGEDEEEDEVADDRAIDDDEELVEEEEEEDEEDDDAADDNIEDEFEEDGDELDGDEVTALLPQFKLGNASVPDELNTALKKSLPAAYQSDPWYTKYYTDTHGPADRSACDKPAKHMSIPGASILLSSSQQLRLLVDKDAASPTRKTAPKKKQQRTEVGGEPGFVHPSLWPLWAAYRKRTAPDLPALSECEQTLLGILMSYADVLDTTRSWDVAVSRMEIVCLHLLNHWFKARTVALAHDAVKKHRPTAGEDDAEDEEFRDRGFGKTRLLLMLPMRNIALRYVATIVNILGLTPDQCPKLPQFFSDFSEVEEAIDPTFKRRPPDYKKQFEGNIDDSFCFGLALGPRRVQVYSHVLNSDILICSPLGLRKRMEKNGDCSVALSSVEMCVIDEAHVLLMQNWQHVSSVLEATNSKPRDTTEGLSDLNRVFAWALNGKSVQHRQSVVLSNVAHAMISATFRSFSNSTGKVLVQRAEEPGVLQRVTTQLRQHFVRVAVTDLQAADDERFRFFTEKLFLQKIHPLLERNVRIILYIPSYFDYVRIRNFLFKDYRDSFACLCEYTSIQDQRKSLGQFTDLERPLLLMTERFYFFKRYFVKLAEGLIFYSPPVMQDFYPHLVSKLASDSPNASVTVLYSKYDAHELRRLVGTTRAHQLLVREAEAYSFVTSATS